MSNGSERSGQQDGFAEHDPWAPPGSPPPAQQARARPDAPSVADRQTVTSMPSPGTHGSHPAAHGSPPGAGTPPGPTASGGPAAPYGQAYYATPAYGQAPYAPAGYAGGYATGPYPAPSPPSGGAPGHGWAPPAPPPSNGLGTAGMVLGIIAACLTATIVGFALGLITGVLAVIFGAVGRARARNGRATNGAQALAGVILGVIALIGSTVVLTALAVEIADRPDGGSVDDGGGGDTYNARPPAVVRVLNADGWPKPGWEWAAAPESVPDRQRAGQRSDRTGLPSATGDRSGVTGPVRPAPRPLGTGGGRTGPGERRPPPRNWYRPDAVRSDRGRCGDHAARAAAEL